METKNEIRPVCLVFCVKSDPILKAPLVCLAVKKKGVGAGRLMGYGGGIEKDEAADYAAKRESCEEGALHIMTKDLEPVAILYCHNRRENGGEFLCVVKVFIARFWVDAGGGKPFGDPVETDEMGVPSWYSVQTLPVSDLLLGDRYWLPEWLPKLVAGKAKIVVTLPYGPWQQTLDGPVRVEVVDELPDK